MLRRTWTRLSIAALASAAVLASAQAQPQAAAAPQLKAQVIFRVLRFVDWPPANLAEGQALQLCLFEESPLAQELQALDGRSISGRVLQVRQMRGRQLGGCHVALVGAGQDWSGTAASTLLVSEGPGMLERGVMLSVQVEDGRVVFDVELDAARRAGLEISAKLLRLARYVRKA